MTLTKSDLQHIGNVIDEKLDNKLTPIEKDLKYLKKKLVKIDKTVDVMVKMFNEDDVKLEKRVRKIEKQLNLPQL